MSIINGCEDNSGSVTDDREIGNVSIAGPAKRDAESNALGSSEPPAKRSPCPPLMLTLPPQTMTHDCINKMYAQLE